MLTHSLSGCGLLTSEDKTTLGRCGRPQLARCWCVAPGDPVLGDPWYLPGPTPLRQPGEGEWASLDLGMWAGQSGAGWPRVGRAQTELGSWAADSHATQGRDLGF